MCNKPIIIFRFHKYPNICLDRIQLLKWFNYEVPFYGIYGGEHNKLPEFEKILKKYLCNIYVVNSKSSEWKWKNFDLILCDWFLAIGQNIDFDMAYVIEWDLLLLGTINDIYKNINNGEIGLTGMIPIKQIEKKWFWTSTEPYMEQWNRLLTFARESYHYNSFPLATLGPGLCFPKSFLTAYCDLYIPELCNDEIRIPLFAQILNFPIKNTGFFINWFDVDERKYFNCDNILIDRKIIKQEFQSNGRKVFHPFHSMLNFDLDIVKK